MAATTSRAASRKKKPGVTPEDFQAIARYITTEIVVERDLEMRMLILGALAGVNIHLIGAPGTAKSLLLREFVSKSIAGADYFEKQVHAQMPADALIGPYDMAEFARSGDFKRKIQGYLPTAHAGIIDEVVRANGPTLDSLLPIMNTQERACELNGGMIRTQLRFLVTASNTWFDPDNTQAQALADRVTIMLLVEDIKSEESFKEMIRRDHARRTTGGSPSTEQPTITLAQFDEAQDAVKHVRCSPEFLDKAAELRRLAKQEGLHISPRRWIELTLLCRANAWMAGRDDTVPEDLAQCEHGLWRDQDQRAVAHKLIIPFHGRFEREAAQKRQEAAKHIAGVEEIKPQVEGTPPNQELEQGVLTKAISASRAIDRVKQRVDEVLGEADKEKRDASSLRELSNELLAQQIWFADNGLPTAYRPD